MSLKIVVLAKQVPDTRNVGPDAMTPEGTVNRSALPAIFNPEDLNALEQALRLKDQNPGTTVTVLTMGPGRAAEVIREAMYRGADGGYLLTDRAFGHQLCFGYCHQACSARCGSDYRWASSHRWRYRSGRSSGSREAGAQPDYLFRGDTILQGWENRCEASYRRWSGDGREPSALCPHGKRKRCSLSPSQCEAGDEVQACEGSYGVGS